MFKYLKQSIPGLSKASYTELLIGNINFRGYNTMMHWRIIGMNDQIIYYPLLADYSFIFIL